MILIFEDRGWEVITTSWTMASKRGGVDICYTWGADGFGWMDSSTGTARRSFDMSVDEFKQKLLDAVPNGVLRL